MLHLESLAAYLQKEKWIDLSCLKMLPELYLLELLLYSITAVATMPGAAAEATEFRITTFGAAAEATNEATASRATVGANIGATAPGIAINLLFSTIIASLEPLLELPSLETPLTLFLVKLYLGVLLDLMQEPQLLDLFHSDPSMEPGAAVTIIATAFWKYCYI